MEVEVADVVVVVDVDEVLVEEDWEVEVEDVVEVGWELVVEVVDVVEVGVVLEVEVVVVLCVVEMLSVVLSVPELPEGEKTPARPATTTAATTIRTMIATAITILPIARLSPDLERNPPFINLLSESDLVKRK